MIFAGADAYSHAKGWEEGMGQKIAGDSTPPVYLGPKQLAELAGLRIIDKGRRCARVYLSGEIEPIQINAIAEKLAVAGVQEAKLYKGIPDRQPEDWRDYLARLREQAERGETLVDEVNRVRGKRAPEDELAPCVESRAGGLYWVTPKIDKSGVMIRPGEWLSDRMRTVGIGNDGSEAYLVIEMIPEGTEKSYMKPCRVMKSVCPRAGHVCVVEVLPLPPAPIYLISWLSISSVRESEPYGK